MYKNKNVNLETKRNNFVILKNYIKYIKYLVFLNSIIFNSI